MAGTNEKFQEAVYNTVLRAVTAISADVKNLLKQSLAKESNETAKRMLASMLENLDIAKEKDKAICQSPGYPTCWIFFGDNNFPAYIPEAVANAAAFATGKGYLRPSIVDPLTRKNSGNNTGRGIPNIELIYVPGQQFVDFFISISVDSCTFCHILQLSSCTHLLCVLVCSVYINSHLF